ncbi:MULTISPECIES: flavin reductase family protein [Pseudobutyrivibrio]|uniref:flavin reductase family protein n=1 Tax=Pseudobutyrivibrio TaxID=46205 RepID=UPI0005D16F80|nr:MULTISPECIES: flavin reductase family protein [Pseudobutyrivibrio]MBE5914452.1 flavin reductase family protein [Pseudobutyrivibrio ruminis]SES88282.1 NADH-FMN oxidoreductase RutF, flavin reductase (DIM6/NTAB) family [Pseudobutyrivibrio sp. C4]SFO09781.1 NADH-FMN oxidoreductase RutF, flavin reductase (DIM6/NTAB) family [Pseudobutyrivibrio sp. JW11]
MGKQKWKAGNMIYPLPAVMITCRDKEGNDNVFTVAWTGTVCTNPPMAYISVRPSRYSYNMIKETGEFVINLTTEELAFATDFCGVKSGRDVDKFEACGLHKEMADEVNVPMLVESPVNIECRVREAHEYGSHTMFVADVLAVHADEKYMNETGKFQLEESEPLAYCHGTYFGLTKPKGTFGYSIKKKEGKKK